LQFIKLKLGMNKVESFMATMSSVSLGIVKVLSNPLLLITAGIGGFLSVYFDNYGPFIEALLVCIFADSLFGVYLAYKKQAFKWEKAMKIVEKMVVYAFYLWIIYVVSKVPFIQNYGDWIAYFTSFIYSLMILNEGRSAFKNGNQVYPNRIAGWVVAVFDKIEGNIKAEGLNGLKENTNS